MRIIDTFDEKQIIREMEDIGVHPKGIPLMLKKAINRVVKIEGVDIRQALIMKQEMLSVGGDASVSKGVMDLSAKRTDVLLIGSMKQYDGLIERLNGQPFGLSHISNQLRDMFSNYNKENFDLNCGKHCLRLSKRTYVMGILNVTPDSFADGGLYNDVEHAVLHAKQMVEDGADIIDVGGESTRPGAEKVTVKEELKRVRPVIERLVNEISVPISIDTYKSQVAKVCLDLGCHLVNDISGLRFSPEMKEIVAEYDVPVIIMHIKGTPRDMQKAPRYKCVISEITSYFKDRIAEALDSGIKRDKIIIDPGIGFGKTTSHNLEIIKRLREFKSLGYPILIGTSRKSLIGNVLDLPIEERLEGTAATVALSIMNGANIIRVHDVREMVRVAKMTDAIRLGVAYEDTKSG
ncbi:MAG: dihydropteroate synthase [bacterium]|nr:dihydropteroate synthase [bacterium]